MSIEVDKNRRSGDPHDIDQVWSVVRELQTGQTQSQSAQAEFNARLGGVEQKLDQLATMITNFITQPKKDFNWIGFGSLVIGILLCAGAYSSAIINPIRNQTEKNNNLVMSRIEQLPSDYREFGRQQATIDGHQVLISDMKSRIHELEITCSKTIGTVEMLREQVIAVDNQGSRKHVLSTPDAVNLK